MKLLSYLVSVAILIFVSFSCLAQTQDNYAKLRQASKADLDALAAAPKPKEQSDLDLEKLASAHRERAKSVQEKTNGLWQSWLVSICEGCGPQMLSYKERGLGDSHEASVGDQTPPTRIATKLVATPPARHVHQLTHQRTASVYADLSPAGLVQIRRMPRE